MSAKKAADEIHQMAHAVLVRVVMASIPLRADGYKWSRTVLSMTDETWTVQDQASVMMHAIRAAKKARGESDYDVSPSFVHCIKRIREARQSYGNEGSVTW